MTAPEHMAVREELMKREPLFHRPEFGTKRSDFERMTAPTFWEVGASGRRFSRQFVLDTLERRYDSPTEEVWEVADFHCFEIATDNYLATYTLIQGERVTRRATIWRHTADGWQVLYATGIDENRKKEAGAHQAALNISTRISKRAMLSTKTNAAECVYDVLNMSLVVSWRRNM